MIVIIFGSPGSGKGTQSELISSSFNLHTFETSKLLEYEFNNSNDDNFFEVDGEKFYIKDEKKIWETGGLCSPPFVTQLVLKEIRRLHSEGKGIVFSGSPRTIYEGEKIAPVLKELYPNKIKVILLDVSAEDAIHRNSNRRICTLMRHSILFSEETKHLKFCPIDGSELKRRKGLDDPETIKVRLIEFRKRTMPLLDFFNNNDLPVNKIDGADTPVNVFNNIVKVLKDDKN